jgi:hypothetical protein
MSSVKPLPWRRGWIPPEGDLVLTADAWLPEEDFLDLMGSNVTTLDKVRDIGCLMLLGEPGAGKSVALAHEAEAVREQTGDVDEVLLIDMGVPQTSAELVESIFGSEEMRRWKGGDGHLHLYLDALDEAKIQIRKVVSILQTQLGRLDTERLRLRITCRTADRPWEFEAWLASKFGADATATLEITPLRASETSEVAQLAGADPEQFLASVLEAGVAPLAARPLTLRMLLTVYQAEGGFPKALSKLYDRALLLMADEVDPERRSLRAMSATECLAVAARIAAATVLSGRDVVGEQSDLDIRATELAGGTEVNRRVAGRSDVVVTEREIAETVATALFTGRARGVGWGHRTFGEYLAAYWLASDRLSDKQVADLLLVDDGDARRVAPSLRNVAGWLLALRPGTQTMLAPADAIVLLDGDPASVAPAARRELVVALLSAIGDQAFDRFGARNIWPRLAYQGIDDDLREGFRDRSQHDQARQAAADAISELRLSALADVLADRALDES